MSQNAEQLRSQVASDQKTRELNLIKEVLQKYIDGSTNGKPHLLKQAFHPDLNLYSIRDKKLNTWSGKKYIESTKPGRPTGETGTILAVDFEHDAAVAKVRITPAHSGRSFIDYFMMLKTGEGWKIVHKMYTRETESRGNEGDWSRDNKTEIKPYTDNPKVEAPSSLHQAVRECISGTLADYDGLNAPGVAVCVMRDGKIIDAQVHGAANVEHRVAIDFDKSLFNIGSTSKQVTAFAILLLAEEHDVKLEDSIRKHIPELSEVYEPVSLKHMMHHTSGVRSELSLLAMAGWTPGDQIRSRDILDMLVRQTSTNFEPGSEFSYSNSGYTLLAEVVSRVSGQPFHEFCRQKIFEPLEMRHTSFSLGYSHLKSDMVYSYGRAGDEFYPYMQNDEYSGSTGLWTTCADFAKWVSNFDSHRVGSEKNFRQLEEIGVLNNGSPTNYALGLMHESYRGLKHVQHGGGTSGYVSYLGRFPDQSVSIHVLGNCNGISARRLALDVADVVLKEEFERTSSGQQPTANPVQLSLEELERFAGRYWNQKDRSVALFLEDGQLIYAVDGGPRITLEPADNLKFRMVGIGVNSHLQFRELKAGEFHFDVIEDRGIVDTFQPYRPTVLTEEELLPFVGEYHCDELDMSYSVTLDDGQLRVRHLRTGEFGLTPITANVFRCESWRCTTLKFQQDNSNAVKGFLLSSMRNRDLAFEKFAAKQEISASEPVSQPVLKSDTGVTRYAEELRKQHRIPGLAIAVLRGEETLHESYHGMANLAHRVPVTSDSVFRLYSLTKPFVAVEAFKLIGAGKLELEDKVEKIVQGVPSAWGNVQIKNLLSHSSGLPDMAGQDPFEFRDLSEDEVVAEVSKRPIRFEAGERFEYNQTNFWLMQKIIEAKLEKKFSECLIQSQFAESDPGNVFFSSDSRDVFAGRATPYFPFINGRLTTDLPYISGDYLHAANGLNMTLRDFVRWDQSLRGGEILNRQLMKKMWTRFPYNSSEEAFASGWSEMSVGRFRGYGFSGSGVAVYATFPELDASVIFLSNGFEEPIRLREVVQDILQLSGITSDEG